MQAKSTKTVVERPVLMQVGAERNELDEPWAKRLNLGLAAASTAMLATYVMHLDTLTPPAALYGWLTPLIPLSCATPSHLDVCSQNA